MWVLIYLAIAVAGLVMVGCFARWLWHRAVALLHEAEVLMERADQLADLLAQIGQPPEPGKPQPAPGSVGDEAEGQRVDDLAMGSNPRPAT